MGKSEEISGDDSAAQPWQSYHTVFTNAKAGMEGVDKEKVQRIVYEMSKGSKYFQNEEKKEADMKHKIENMRARCAKLTPADISHYQKIADRRILELEATRDLSKIWLHVDMDAFYAAVETLSNPSLKGKPMAVGGMSMISTANYEARKFGVRAAMPGFIACKLCPELIFVPTDFKKYTYYSDITRNVFQKYDPCFMAASLDEAYLDITNVCKERNITGAEVAEELRSGVYEATGLTCSAGVGPNRLLAKVCSDINKPNGQFVLLNDRLAVMTFISSLPIRKIGGIGKVTENILKDVFGIKTCEDLLKKSCFLCALFSHSSADFFLSVGLGLGGTDTPQARLRKSMSNERTFSATDDEAFFNRKLVELTEMLSADMKKEGLCGRTLTLKLKTASFEVRTRAVTVQNYIWSSEDILKHALKLLNAELPVSLRLIGLRISQFNEEKDGDLSDPLQKTLSNFVILGNAEKKVDDHSISGSDVKDRSKSAYDESTNPSSDQKSDQGHSKCNLSYENGEVEESNGLECNEFEAKVTKLSVMTDKKSNEFKASELVEADSFLLSGQFEARTPDQTKGGPLLDDEAGCSSNHKEHCTWIDDYKCSLCGVELPPSFVEERQEHFDFHLAEKLQEEESSITSRSLTLKRLIEKDHNANRSRGKKKQKQSSSDGKHIPIDKFFAKRSQNL